ncbi:PIN domain-containing protein [Thermus caldilimi]|uniref:PIN domain-containing protein n=1 Tax=Thermus caldilimi TaxID=2483360 RepID=UPI001F11243A|nr:PIN domain-containing protein [Thermus caldilimi]
MISLDTNILFAALDRQNAQHEKAISLLDELSREILFVSPPVYVELRAGQGWPPELEVVP